MENVPAACTSKSNAYMPYENFTYSNDLLGCILIENMKETDFTGISVSAAVMMWFDCHSLLPRASHPPPPTPPHTHTYVHVCTCSRVMCTLILMGQERITLLEFNSIEQKGMGQQPPAASGEWWWPIWLTTSAT